MRKTIYISCLLKDNMIIAYRISSNKKTMPHDYYKDFYYSGTSMENCDEIYKVEYMSVEFEDKENSNFNNYIFEKVAREFYKQWEIHPKHWGDPAYEKNYLGIFMELEEAKKKLELMEYKYTLTNNDDKAIETVLKALENQDIRIDKLLKRIKKLNREVQYFMKNKILKKIEDKIEELENRIPKNINCADDYDLDNEINYKIEVLKELLEDK